MSEKNKSGAAAKQDDSFKSAAAPAASAAPVPASAPASGESPKKQKRPRTPIEERIKNMKRGERAIYYSQHYTALQNQLTDLKTLVGDEAVKLAEEQFLKD